MIGGAYMGCAELLGDPFDGLQPRPAPDAGPNSDALVEVTDGSEVGDVTTGTGGSGALGNMRTFPSAVAMTSSARTPPPDPPQLGSVVEPPGSSDAPEDDPVLYENVEREGGAPPSVGRDDAGLPDPGGHVPAFPAAWDAGLADAANDVPSAPACAPSSPFSRVELVTGIPVNVARIRLSNDELTAHFSWWKESSQWLDLFTSRRADPASPFSVPEALTQLNGSGAEASPSLTPDGSTLYFESSRTGAFQVHEAKRNDAGDWAPLGVVPNLSVVGFSDGGPFLASRSGDLYFHSDRLGDADLFRAPRGETGFDVPIPLLDVSTEEPESFPLVSADELSIYFVRTAAGAEHSEMWMATRSSESEPFGGARPVVELNTDRIELPDWISQDNCRLYFSRMPLHMWIGSVVYVAIREPAAGASAGN